MKISPFIETWILAQDQAPPAAPPAGGGFGLFVPMILMFVIFYFLLIRPQRKKQKELAEQIDAMKVGDYVVTAGGIHGLVANKSRDVVTVKVADNVKLRFDKASIAKVTPKASLKDDDDEEVVEEKEEEKE